MFLVCANKLIAFFLIAHLVTPLLGQLPDTDSGTNPSPQSNSPFPMPRVSVAVEVKQDPVIDGEVINDRAWDGVPKTEGFWQTRPFEGKQASERTEVRIAYTQDTLYFAVICYDRNPENIIASGSLRDSPLDETDSFQIILDTYQDRQNGFIFGTNPVGIEYDAQVSSEGQGGSMRSGGGLNINWDAPWKVSTQISNIGWSTEFAIPFTTLRYPNRPLQVWGINFQRNIRRKNEIAFWAPLPRQFTLTRLSQAGTLEGLKIPSQKNLQIMPYFLGQARKKGNEHLTRTGEIGIDGKYSVTPSLTLDLTYNTDFAQVEVDELQINLDRFNLFFPEKRPFFLENAGLFAVGEPEEAQLFFSRRIGIGTNGEVIPILGGARLTGKIAGTNVGFLNMQTESLKGVASANNFTVGRISRELPNRSSIGGIFINRQGTGKLTEVKNYNRSYAVDGTWGIGKYGEITGWLAATSTPQLAGDEYGFNVIGRYDSQKWLLTSAYTHLGENFNPEVGFLAREGGYRRPEFYARRRYRPDNFIGIHELRPHIMWRGFYSPDGFFESGKLHVDNHWEWRNGYELHTGINFLHEGVKKSFEIFPGVEVPPGIYNDKEALLEFWSNQGSWLSAKFSARAGGYYGGDQVKLSPTLKMRYGETFNTELSWVRSKINLSTGDFVANLGRLRISYSFTPKISIQALLQYNDRDNIWASNLRFSLLQTANTGLFIVYNTIRDLGHLQTNLPDRRLMIKLNRIVDIFN